MISLLRGGRRLGAVALALGLLVASTSNAFAHARYDRSEPPAGSMVDGQPFVLTAYFTQELTSKSTLRVLDANGVQIDLGDGHVDLNDPDREIMYVTLPELPVGVYTVEYSAESAEDGHTEPGTFAFGVGMTPPSATDPAYQPAGGSGPLPVENADAMVLDAY
jgi:methionine-rich copper-binding protein CopC